MSGKFSIHLCEKLYISCGKNDTVQRQTCLLLMDSISKRSRGCSFVQGEQRARDGRVEAAGEGEAAAGEAAPRYTAATSLPPPHQALVSYVFHLTVNQNGTILETSYLKSCWSSVLCFIPS